MSTKFGPAQLPEQVETSVAAAEEMVDVAFPCKFFIEPKS